MKCRICGNQDLSLIINLGYQPLADRFLTYDQLQDPEIYYPLDVWMCDHCGLAQLGYVVPKEVLYQDAYPYLTGQNVEGVKHFRKMAVDVVCQFGLKPDDLVVDIGSNDGTLLKGFRDLGCRVVGIEPCEQIAQHAGLETISKFFSTKMVGDHFGPIKTKVITATNVFAHVNDLQEFMRAIDMLLAPDGVFIIEAPNFYKQLENNDYTQIYHEHLSYLSPEPVCKLVKQFGMTVDGITWHDIHGGTLRYHVKRGGRISAIMRPKIGDFVKKVERGRNELKTMLHEIKRKGKTIYGVSAPAKGNTLLNYCRIGTDILDCITEKTPMKIGKFTPGQHIPVVPDSWLIEDMPDYALLLAWNFSESIMGTLHEYTDKGGRWIIPIPEPHIIAKDAWHKIDGL